MMRSLSVMIATLIFLLVAFIGGAVRADPVTVRAADHGTYARIVFNWPSPVVYEAENANNTVTVRFNRPIEGPVANAVGPLRNYLRAAEIGPDGQTVILRLTGPMALNAFDLGRAVVLDLTPGAQPKKTAKAQAKTPPASPAAQPATGATAPAVLVRSGQHKNYSRLEIGRAHV